MILVKQGKACGLINFFYQKMANEMTQNQTMSCVRIRI
jgi:hypothetical protein